MATAGARIGILGATGALGGEVLAALDRSSVGAAAIDAFGTDRSLGQEIDYQGQIYPVSTEVPDLRKIASRWRLEISLGDQCKRRFASGS